MDKGYLDEDNPFDSKTLLLDRNKQKLQKSDFTDFQYELLTKSKYFCMLPWIHMHGWANGDAHPCCVGDYNVPIGNLRENTFEEVWNGEGMRRMRLNMLQEKPSPQCVNCYEKEKNGFMSLRQESNRNFAYVADYVDDTQSDGSVEPNIIYWDMRFSNLCNFSCVMCGPEFSSNWVKNLNNLHGKNDSKIMYARGNKELNWEMVEPYIDNLHKIYFAGGEPLMMEEHWKLIDELLKRGKNDIELWYNTNFSETKYKGRSAFELWKEFETVSIGASLDAMGARAEYIRYGTKWDRIVRNREEMLEICPEVDFFISCTLQVFNSYHIVDFHNDWVNRGLIKTYDFNVNILQGPECYRLSVLPEHMKEEVIQLYEEHLENIKELDDIKRASSGFEGAINLMVNEDKTNLLPSFRELVGYYERAINKTNCFIETFPELKELMDE